MEFSKLLDKAYGCFLGEAIGDAMGMPTSVYTLEGVKEEFDWVDSFLPAPECHAIHGGMKAGEVTDDTTIAVIKARAIIENKGEVDAKLIAEYMYDWAKRENMIGSSLIGPSTTKALKEIKKGKPIKETGKLGYTDGAAMSIAPVGIINYGNIKRGAKDAEEASKIAHDCSMAIEGSAAVACAIAEAMTGDSTVDSIVEAAKYGARYGRTARFIIPAASVEKMIEWALKIVKESESRDEMFQDLYDYIGNSLLTNEAVPTAVALFVAAEGDPMTAIEYGTNMGGDADTVAAMAGAIGGAFKGPEAFPEDLKKQVQEVNNFDLKQLSKKLLESRG